MLRLGQDEFVKVREVRVSEMKCALSADLYR